MEQKRVFVIFDHDIIGYPPTLSLINILLSLNKKVFFIGHYSDSEGKTALENKGVVFKDIDVTPNYSIKNGFIRKINILHNLKKYEKVFFETIKDIQFKEDDLIWFIFSEKALYMYDFLKHHRYIVQFYEFVDAEFGKRYKYLYPKYDVRKLLQNAAKVVHCEYNRAVIMNGLYGVKGKLNILPNKPVFEEPNLLKAPKEMADYYNLIKNNVQGKKVILYQGIFTSEERRLEEFCEAVKKMPSNFVFMAMGGGAYWEELQKKYVSDKFVFVPFIKPPFHLLFTQLASVGVLNYLPVAKSIADVINPVYCAPNKVYEYTKYSIPILANDIPALRSIVEKYNCGRVVEQPMSPQMISDAIFDIIQNYEEESSGAKLFYDSVNMKELVSDIVNVSH